MTRTEAYDVLRYFAPGAGGRTKAGGYDLVDYGWNRPYLVLTYAADGTDAQFALPSDDDLERHDPKVIEHLRSKAMLRA